MTDPDAAIVALLREITCTVGDTSGVCRDGRTWAVPEKWVSDWRKRADELLRDYPATCGQCAALVDSYYFDTGTKEPAAEYRYKRMVAVCREHNGFSAMVKVSEVDG